MKKTGPCVFKYGASISRSHMLGFRSSTASLLIPASGEETARVAVICTYHHAIDGYPAVMGEVLQHGHQELQAAIPVTQQKHHANEVHNAYHSTGQVIGHVEDLWSGANCTDK